MARKLRPEEQPQPEPQQNWRDQVDPADIVPLPQSVQQLVATTAMQYGGRPQLQDDPMAQFRQGASGPDGMTPEKPQYMGLPPDQIGGWPHPLHGSAPDQAGGPGGMQPIGGPMGDFPRGQGGELQPAGRPGVPIYPGGPMPVSRFTGGGYGNTAADNAMSDAAWWNKYYGPQPLNRPRGLSPDWLMAPGELQRQNDLREGSLAETMTPIRARPGTGMGAPIYGGGPQRGAYPEISEAVAPTARRGEFLQGTPLPGGGVYSGQGGAAGQRWGAMTPRSYPMDAISMAAGPPGAQLGSMLPGSYGAPGPQGPLRVDPMTGAPQNPYPGQPFAGYRVAGGPAMAQPIPGPGDQRDIRSMPPVPYSAYSGTQGPTAMGRGVGGSTGPGAPQAGGMPPTRQTAQGAQAAQAANQTDQLPYGQAPPAPRIEDQLRRVQGMFPAANTQERLMLAGQLLDREMQQWRTQLDYNVHAGALQNAVRQAQTAKTQQDYENAMKLYDAATKRQEQDRKAQTDQALMERWRAQEERLRQTSGYNTQAEEIARQGAAPAQPSWWERLTGGGAPAGPPPTATPGGSAMPPARTAPARAPVLAGAAAPTPARAAAPTPARAAAPAPEGVGARSREEGGGLLPSGDLNADLKAAGIMATGERNQAGYLIPPPRAIEFLRNNPKMTSDFDKIFGPGASKKYLGR